MKKIRNKKERGITLIALVVTIIVLIVLAGISINLVFGNLGIITKEKEAKEENLKQTAKEVMNLKITSIQIENYTENKTLPSLQFLADKLCEDSDMEYVLAQSKAHASLDKIDTTNLSSIYTKLKYFDALQNQFPCDELTILYNFTVPGLQCPIFKEEIL